MRTLLSFLVLVFLVGCQKQAPTGWRPDSHVYPTNQPNLNDITGSYQLTRQNLTTNGLVALEGRLCQLDLQSDGSFSITNYPSGSPASFAKQQFANFVSTTGSWTSSRIGSVRDQPLWGVRFESITHLDPAKLAGTSAPYSLVFVYGDSDAGREIVFERKK